MTDLEGLLAFARELAEIGGRIAEKHYGSELQREKKADGSWVTEADWKAEAQMRLRIARAFPDHNILGEEEGLTSAGGGEPKEGAPIWVLDPIDGTNNFMSAIPIWATLVGLRIDGEASVGVAHAPVLGETYDAAIGAGARMNGRPISVDDSVTDLSEATSLIAGLETPGLEGFFDAIVHGSWRTRGFGDFWGHMLVARGAAHVMIDPELRDWDFVALAPIVSEAGGRLTQIEGSPLVDGGSGLSTNGSLHDEVLGLARGTLRPGD